MFKHKIVLGSVVFLFAAGWAGQTLCQTQGPGQRGIRPDARQSQQLTAEQRRKEFEKRVAAENKERQDRWMAEQLKKAEQRAGDNANGKNEHRNKLIRQTLELTEAQWKVIEPKINKVCFFKGQSAINLGVSDGYIGRSGAGGGGSGGSSGGGTSSTGTGAGSTWQTRSSGGGSGTAMGGGSGAGAGGGAGGGGGGASGWASGGSGGGGIKTLRLNWPLWRYAGRELTEGEKTCEELQKLLEDKNSKQEDIDQKIETLRRARENAAKELVKARQELREVLTARQQARLVLMGLLD